MKSFLLTIFSLTLIFSCTSNVKESVVHRRNFAKNVFEEEFASVQVGCDTVNMKVMIPNTKWLSIDSKYASKESPGLYSLELNKKLSLKERTYNHDLVLEKIENDAFMFRYTGVQVAVDTLYAVDLEKLDSKIDSTRIFNFEGNKYYRVSKDLAGTDEVKTIFKSMRTEDKGRVVCACDYYL